MSMYEEEIEKELNDICDIVAKSLQTALRPLAEKIMTMRSRDEIIKNVLKSLPEYNSLIEEKTASAETKDVEFIISEK